MFCLKTLDTAALLGVWHTVGLPEATQDPLTPWLLGF
jgi:hypothetical protein